MSQASRGQKTTDSINGKLTFEQDKNRIIGRDANNIPRLILLADGDDFFMKISKNAINVLEATDDQLNFNSLQNNFKIVKSGDLIIPSVTVPGSTGNYDSINTTLAAVAHGLPYKPGFIAFFEQSTGVRVGMPYSSNDVFSASRAFWSTHTPAVNSTSFFVNLRASTFGGSVNSLPGTVKYYLLQETAD